MWAPPLFSVPCVSNPGPCCSFMFDEPSSYLDVKQRLRAARAIRSLLESNKYIIVVEHDLSVLDYLSDYICCLYGVPGAYGVVTMPFSVREGSYRCSHDSKNVRERFLITIFYFPSRQSS